MKTLRDCQVAFVGAGELAEALIEGLLRARCLEPNQVRATNRSRRERLDDLQHRFHILTDPRKEVIVRGTDLVVLAVKPGEIREAAAQTVPLLAEDTVVISVAAGVPTLEIRSLLDGHQRIVRAMPNTACRVGRGVTALCGGPDCDPDALALAESLFSKLGTTVKIDEQWFNAVTAISGSGPAYVFLFVESMLDAARDMGIPDDVARTLTVETILGAGTILAHTDESPAALRRQVVSPGGTTAAALGVMEEAAVPEAIRRAVLRASERAGELSQVRA